GRRVPDAHDLVFASRGEAPAVRAEGDAQNESAMRKRVEQLAGHRIPYVHAAAEAGRGQVLAVRAERQRGDAARFGEGAQRLAPRLRVPKVHSPRPPPGRQALPVATERHADRADLPLLVSGEGVQALMAPPVSDHPVAVTSRHELSAVAGAER